MYLKCLFEPGHAGEFILFYILKCQSKNSITKHKFTTENKKRKQVPQIKTNPPPRPHNDKIIINEIHELGDSITNK